MKGFIFSLLICFSSIEILASEVHPKSNQKNILIEKAFNTKIGRYIFFKIEERLVKRQERLSKKLEKAIKLKKPQQIKKIRYQMSAKATYKKVRRTLIIVGLICIPFGLLLTVLDRPAPGQFLTWGSLIGASIFILGVILIFLGLLIGLFHRM